MRPLLFVIWALALCLVTLAGEPLPPAQAAAAGAWPVKPDRPPRLAPPRLSAPVAKAALVRPERPGPQQALAALRKARVIAQALRASPAPARPSARREPLRSTRGAVGSAGIQRGKPVQRPAAVRGTRARRLAPRLARRVYPRRRYAARWLPRAELREVARPQFLGDLYVQASGARLYASASRGQVIGQLPPATIVTNMGRLGSWYKVEAPNGLVGLVAAGALGPLPPAW
ncbi:MAG: SH3 domain-containing protein [Candidatus Sericytochromatia bacterium]|nr:SH3 domain-containing protein [Candidatus Sericytochromatia bacterium]